MPIRPALPTIDYASRDWDTIRSSVIDFLRKRFPRDWTDFTESNIGVALIEAVAYMFDNLSYAVDRSVNENFISTATQRESVARLAALVGYKLTPSTAASVTLITPVGELDGRESPIEIASGTAVQAGDVIFEVDRDYTITKVGDMWSTNNSTPSIVAVLGAVEGVSVKDVFTSFGGKFQTYQGGSSSYIDGSMTVTVDGVVWTLVDNLVLGDPDDQENIYIYEVVLDRDDRPTVKFGDGASGATPSDLAEINLLYRVGGGSRGNVASNTINTSIPCVENGNNTTIKVTNGDAPASGGTDRESLERAKLFAPVWGRTTDRAITYNDYLALSNGFSDGVSGRIAKAGVVVNRSDGLSNFVTIYAWSEDVDGNLVVAPTPLKAALKQFLEVRKVVTVRLSDIQDGNLVPVDFDLLLSVYRGFDRSDVTRRVTAVLSSLFRSSPVRYDNQLRLSWVHDYILTVPGVRGVSVRSPQPVTQTFSLVPIYSSSLPAQTGLPNQIVITSDAARAANYYFGFYVLVGNPGSQAKFNIVSSTPVGASGQPITLTIDGIPPLVSVGTQVVIQHDFKVKLGSTPNGDVTNLRMVIPGALGGAVDLERSVVSIDSENIITVNAAWSNYPVSPSQVISAVITPDYYVDDTKALVLGTVNLQVED